MRPSLKGQHPPRTAHQKFFNEGSKEKSASFTQHYSQYLHLAKEAVTAGDRIKAENYYQYAEHYLRLLKDDRPLTTLE